MHLWEPGCERVFACARLGTARSWNFLLNNGQVTEFDDLSKKCSRSIGILYKVKQFLPESALLSLYYTLFLSHIIYGITAWSSANSVDKDRLVTVNTEVTLIHFLLNINN